MLRMKGNKKNKSQDSESKLTKGTRYLGGRKWPMVSVELPVISNAQSLTHVSARTVPSTDSYCLVCLTSCASSSMSIPGRPMGPRSPATRPSLSNPSSLPSVPPLNIRPKAPKPVLRLEKPVLRLPSITPPIRSDLSPNDESGSYYGSLPQAVERTTTSASSSALHNADVTVRPPMKSTEPITLEKLQDTIGGLTLKESAEDPRPSSTADDKWDDDRFTEVRRLGEGAGGAVHQVKDIRTDLIMARKTIPTRSTPAQQLLRELKFLSECNHPNICKFYGAYISHSSSEVKILMELCEGGSLEAVGKRIRARGGRLGEPVVGRLAEGVSNLQHSC